MGCRLHLTKTCDDDAPHPITHAETAPGPVADGNMTPAIHAGLQAGDLLPGEHLADTGHVDAELLVRSRQDRVDWTWSARRGRILTGRPARQRASLPGTSAWTGGGCG